MRAFFSIVAGLALLVGASTTCQAHRQDANLEQLEKGTKELDALVAKLRERIKAEQANNKDLNGRILALEIEIGGLRLELAKGKETSAALETKLQSTATEKCPPDPKKMVAEWRALFRASFGVCQQVLTEKGVVAKEPSEADRARLYDCGKMTLEHIAPELQIEVEE